jgi:hypothetical protein
MDLEALSYENLEFPSEYRLGDKITVSAEIKYWGNRTGPVELVASVDDKPRAQKRLVLSPGTSLTTSLTFTIPERTMKPTVSLSVRTDTASRILTNVPLSPTVDKVSLRWDQTVSGVTDKPVSFLCTSLSVFDDEGSQLLVIDTGAEDGGLFEFGVSDSLTQNGKTARWFHDVVVFGLGPVQADVASRLQLDGSFPDEIDENSLRARINSSSTETTILRAGEGPWEISLIDS